MIERLKENFSDLNWVVCDFSCCIGKNEKHQLSVGMISSGYKITIYDLVEKKWIYKESGFCNLDLAIEKLQSIQSRLIT